VDRNPDPRRRARSVFEKGVTVTYPYGKDLPSPTYHPNL
jgi:hypothetical protein